MRRSSSMWLLAGLLISAPVLANSLTVTSSGLNGTGKKLQVNCTNTDDNVYVLSDEPTNEKHYKATFLISPAGLNLESNKNIHISTVGLTGDNGVFIKLKRNDTAGSWELKVRYRLNGQPPFFAMPNLFLMTQAASNQTRLVTFEYQAESSGGAGDGFMKITKSNIDGSSSSTKTVTLGTTQGVESIRFGILKGKGVNCAAGTSSYYFDEFSSFR